MGMMIEVLPPCVQYGGEADLGSEVFGVGGDRQEGSRGGPEQKSIDHRLVLIGDCADFGGQREHDVVIGDRQEFGLSHRQPSLRRSPLTLGAMAVAAGIVGDARMSTILATLDMTAERGRATNLDRRHDAALSEAYVAGIGRAPRLTVAAEDVRHLKLWLRHGRRFRPAAAIRYSIVRAGFESGGSCRPRRAYSVSSS